MTDRTQSFDYGVHVFLNKPVRVEFVYSDADLTDFYYPNGAFNQKRFEVLSYITGSKLLPDAAEYLTPPGELPPSETEGLGTLDLVGQVFTNLPTDIGLVAFAE